MNKPSKAAMKAARGVISDLKVFFLKHEPTAQRVAEVIDRETGLPELLEAAKMFIREYENTYIPHSSGKTALYRGSKLLQTAIARVEESDE